MITRKLRRRKRKILFASAIAGTPFVVHPLFISWGISVKVFGLDGEGKTSQHPLAHLNTERDSKIGFGLPRKRVIPGLHQSFFGSSIA